MAKMLQIRDMPEELHRRLKVRASHAGMTLSAYVLAELQAIAERPTPAELLARLGELEPVRLGADEIIDAVRSGRETPVGVEAEAAGEASVETRPPDEGPSYVEGLEPLEEVGGEARAAEATAAPEAEPRTP